MLPYNFRSFKGQLRKAIHSAVLLFLACISSCLPALSQAPDSNQKSGQPAIAAKMPDVLAQKKAAAGPEQLAPDAAVITINGFCPGSAVKEPSTCSTRITRQQFSEMLAAMSFNTQLLSNPVAIKAFAESYVQALLVADAAEKSGMDKDAQFEELMRIIRVRTLADTYRRSLQQKNSNPAGEQIENYYKQNAARFDQMELDRISIPLSNPKLAKDVQSDFRQKAQSLATEARLRLVTGEDPGKIQAEAYRTLGLTPPLTTDLGTKRRGSLPGALEQELFAMKSGDVSKVQSDGASLSVYKIRNRSTLPLERVRGEIVQEIQQREIQAAMQAITAGVKIDFNEQYFKPHTTPANSRTNSSLGAKTPLQ